MDYNWIIDWLRRVVEHGDTDPQEYCTNRCGGCEVCDKAADALETLLAERDAAVEDLKFSGGKRCHSCIYDDRSIHDFPCNSCCEAGGMSEYWEWRGQQKGDRHGYGDLPPM